MHSRLYIVLDEFNHHNCLGASAPVVPGAACANDGHLVRLYRVASAVCWLYMIDY